MFRVFLLILISSAAVFAPDAASAKSGKNKKGYHCELKKNGKTVDDHSIKARKICKKKGGKWVKDHDDHDHDHDGEDHEHEED